MSEETLAVQETALAALRPGGTGAVVETWCDLVWVEGPDAERFLQGTLTNDVAALAEGDSCEALLLEAKGRIRHGVVVHRDGAEAFTLVASPDHGEALCDDLEALHVSEDLEIFWDRARMAITNAAGDAGGEHLEVALRPAGLRGVVGGAPGEVARALGVPAVPREALDALRVEVGAADPDVDGAGRLVQEAGLDGVAVSFSKGCYLGQETVARASHRGGVRRRLVGVALDAPVAAGTVLRHDGREVGTTGTCARHPSLGPVALAVVRDGVPEGADLAVEGRSTPARLLELPLAAA